MTTIMEMKRKTTRENELETGATWCPKGCCRGCKGSGSGFHGAGFRIRASGLTLRGLLSLLGNVRLLRSCPSVYCSSKDL